jgi:hypothetical protein
MTDLVDEILAMLCGLEGLYLRLSYVVISFVVFIANVLLSSLTFITFATQKLNMTRSAPVFVGATKFLVVRLDYPRIIDHDCSTVLSSTDQ